MTEKQLFLRKLELAAKHPDTLVPWRPFEFVRQDRDTSFRPAGPMYKYPTYHARRIIFNMMGKS